MTVLDPAVEIRRARPHLNDHVPGKWFDLCRLHDLINSPHFKPQGGVYRLVALTEEFAPLTLDRVCGHDQTGTLYIGQTGKALRSRLLAPLRSVSDRRRRPPYVVEEHAAQRLRQHPLAKNFSANSLAVTWSFHSDPRKAESKLFRLYFNSFGESPPLNRSF